MAVRAFDVSAPTTRVVEPAPPRRADRRRSRQRWALVGAVALVVPFATALVVVGVGH
jgi:hypothetical protein